MKFIARSVLRLAGLACVGALLSPAAAQWNSAATAPHAPKAIVVESLRLDPGKATTALRLAPIDVALVDAARRANSAGIEKRLQIGIGRNVDRVEADSASLRWVAAAGGFAAQWEVTSPGAQALRVALLATRMEPGVEIRFAGRAGTDTVYGPYFAADLLIGNETYWSPVLEGESAIVEVWVPGAAPPSDFGLGITQVSHLFASPSHPAVESLAKASGSCEVDFICRAATDPALANVGKAVAKMTFGDGVSGGSFLCTGTLLNPLGGSFTPYFFSAHHCISTQAAANTLTTHWFYERTGCGTGSVSPAYVQLPGGAALLYANAHSDALLLRLNSAPPAGAVFAGWDATTLSTGTPVVAVHHPVGDVKKVSLGTVAGFDDPRGGSNPTFIVSNWNALATGVVEGGSSGSGLFTLVANEYRLRGGLLGGPSSCTASASARHDYYSRFDQTYPAIAQYLNPVSNPCTYTLSPASRVVGASATTGSLGLTATAGCAWSVTSNVSWLTASGSGNGNGTIGYSVAANSGATSRVGTLTIAGQSFTLTQQAAATGGTNIVSNAAFENGTASWTQSATGGFAIITNGADGHSGSWYAWLGGYDSGIDTLYQEVHIPNDATQASLRFWYRIDTSEGTTTTPYDTMTVTIASAATGTPLATLATFSNVNRTSGWVQSQAYDASAFRGQTVRLVFRATTDVSNVTSFLIDDISLAVTTSAAAASYQGLWLKTPFDSEAGWGLNLTHQGSTLFGTWFTYDTDGSGMWLVMSNGAQTSPGNFTGTLYRTTGPGFNAVPFTSITFPANYTAVGTLSLSFTDANTGTMTYTVTGVTQSKPIGRYIYATGGTNCTLGGTQGAAPNYQDLWWNSPADSESGWGVNLTHQGDILFATWFTYEAGGTAAAPAKGMWLVMSNGNRTSPGVYTGTLYRTTGPPFNAVPFTPIGPGNYTIVGSMTFTFTDANNGTFRYTVNGSTQTKQITRLIYSSPTTVCQ